MPSIYQLKTRFQSLLRPLVNSLATKKVTANQVTLAAIGLSGFGGLCMVIGAQQNWPWLLLPLLLFLRMGLNAIDGMLAREHNMKSRLGAILNELGDVVSDSLLYLPFALLTGIWQWLVVVICLLSVISEMAGLIGIQIGASRRYDGPMGKSDRAFVFGTSGFILGLGVVPGNWLNIVFLITAILLILTIRNRAKSALKEAGLNG